MSAFGANQPWTDDSNTLGKSVRRAAVYSTNPKAPPSQPTTGPTEPNTAPPPHLYHNAETWVEWGTEENDAWPKKSTKYQDKSWKASWQYDQQWTTKFQNKWNNYPSPVKKPTPAPLVPAPPAAFQRTEDAEGSSSSSSAKPTTRPAGIAKSVPTPPAAVSGVKIAGTAQSSRFPPPPPPPPLQRDVMSNREKAQHLCAMVDGNGPPTPDDIYELIRNHPDLRQDTKEAALDVFGQLSTDLSEEVWVETFPVAPTTYQGSKLTQVNFSIANGIGPEKPLAGAGNNIYHWAHGTTPQGAVQIVQDRRVKRTLESTMGDSPTWGFFGMATNDASAESLQAIISKVRGIGKGAFGLIMTGHLVSPVQHEPVSSGGNVEDQEACYRSGISHRQGSHWCMREDLSTVTGLTVICSLPIEKQEHVPLFQELSADRS